MPAFASVGSVISTTVTLGGLMALAEFTVGSLCEILMEAWRAAEIGTRRKTGELHAEKSKLLQINAECIWRSDCGIPIDASGARSESCHELRTVVARTRNHRLDGGDCAGSPMWADLLSTSGRAPETFRTGIAS